MKEPLRVRATRRAARETFPLWRQLGLHVTAVHFYEPIPDTRGLPDSTWEPSELAGVDMREEAQLALLDEFAQRYGAEYAAIPSGRPSEATTFSLANPSFGPVDAEILYCMVRTHRPSRIIEVGSGYTTLLMAQALRANGQDGVGGSDYTAIDPFPNKTVGAGVEGLTNLIEAPVQEVPLHEFAALSASDILFIDSSHVVGIGTDVQYLFLEVIPRLAPGVIVHVHDIFMPDEYPRRWVTQEHRFWTEQYLLQAFLMFNDSWDVLFACSHMRQRHPEALAAAFPSYRPGTLPGSFWMQRHEHSHSRDAQ